VSPPAIRDVRDGAVLVEYPESSDREANRAAVTLGIRLRARGKGGVLDAVPGARSLLVVFDPSRLSRSGLTRRIERVGEGAREPDGTRRLFRVPVAYGGADGPDLGELARELGVPEGEFARRHAAAEYRVAFIGFAPGFPYLTGLPPELSAKRLPSPRPRVPAGSVAIGGSYSGVYPAVTPGGWRLIGRSGVRLFDPAADPPSLLAAGDRVRFEAVTHAELAAPPVPEPPGPAGPAVLRVLSAGAFASIQAAPRHGLGSFGVPAGGAMDTRSLARANVLVGNAPQAPALEIALAGPELEALGEVSVAIAGADLEAAWNGKPAPFDEAFRMAAGDRLRFGRARRGARAYLAVRDGLAAGLLTRRLEAGEEIAVGSQPSAVSRTPAPVVDVPDELSLRVILGPQADWFEMAEINRFLTSGWRVSTMSDRRGLRLEGPPIPHVRAPEIAPEGAVFGSVQVPGGGAPIVLGPDGPVTGGYPKIATVIGPDLPRLGQAAPGALLRFSAVSLAEALEASRGYH